MQGLWQHTHQHKLTQKSLRHQGGLPTGLPTGAGRGRVWASGAAPTGGRGTRATPGGTLSNGAPMGRRDRPQGGRGPGTVAEFDGSGFVEPGEGAFGGGGGGGFLGGTTYAGRGTGVHPTVTVPEAFGSLEGGACKGGLSSATMGGRCCALAPCALGTDVAPMMPLEESVEGGAVRARAAGQRGRCFTVQRQVRLMRGPSIPSSLGTRCW